MTKAKKQMIDQIGLDGEIELNFQSVRTGLGLVEDILPLVSDEMKLEAESKIKAIESQVDCLETVLLESVKMRKEVS